MRDRPGPIRNGFVENLTKNSGPGAPLAQLLRGGQGGAVRLKLLLALLWFSVAAPHTTTYPARSWAGLLGLEEPDTNGARRISAALEWLQSRRLIEIKTAAGMPSTIKLLDERATGEPYQLPYTALMEKRSRGEDTGKDDYYLGLPVEFFTNGWVAILSAPAVAMLLVMVRESKYSGRTNGIWLAPTPALERFGLSEDTRSAGLNELTDHHILDKSTRPVSRSGFDMKRRRNVYDLHLEQLEVPPGEQRPAKKLEPRELNERLEVPAQSVSEDRSQPGTEGLVG